MGLSARQLAPGEAVVISTRTHPKVLAGPVLLLLVIVAVAAFCAALVPQWQHRSAARAGIAVAAALLVLRLVVWPFAQWLAETLTLTDRRLAYRDGVLRRAGRDIPVQRVAEVSSERSVSDRVFGSGTLVVATAGETGQFVFDDIPHVREFETALSELLYPADEVPQRPRTPASRR